MQQIDPRQPLVSTLIGKQPMVINVHAQQNADYYVGGMPQGTIKIEPYVLLSALPEELRNRVVTAIQAIMSGM